MTRTVIAHPEHDREQGLGYLAVSWIEFFCVHGPGDVAERPLDPALPDALPLGEEMLGFIADCYATDSNGRRLYHDVFVSRAKGWAKSELAGFIVLFEALGPCRVARDAFGLPRRARGGEEFRAGDFVYTYEPGEFMGEPITDPIIRCLATEEGQAGNTYDNVYLNLGGYGQGSQRLISAYGIRRNDVGLLKVKLPGAGEIIPSSASSSSKDGGKETFAVFDESHLYTTPELHRMYDTVGRNLTKRKAAEPWSLETSTMYAPGEGSVAEQTHKHARMIRESKTKAIATLFDHRQAPDDVIFADPASLRTGIIEAYGDAATYTDIDRKVNDFYDPRKSLEDLKRYTLNQPTAPSNAWMTAPEWARIAKPGEKLNPGDKITLGFDGSQKRAKGLADSTALVACRVSDRVLFLLKIDEQPEGPLGTDWEVDFDGFLTAVEEAFELYDVVGFYADPPLWQEAVANWDLDYGDRLQVKASGKSAVGWWTNRETLMGRALDSFANAVKDLDVFHDGDIVLQRHILNARMKPRGQHMRIMKETAASRNKIDAAVAAVLAFQACLDYISAGDTVKPKRRFRAVVLR